MKENMTHLLNRVVTFYQGELKKKLNQICISSGVVSWQSAAQAYRNTRPIIRHDGGNEGRSDLPTVAWNKCAVC
jgi:hypothetical protein